MPMDTERHRRAVVRYYRWLDRLEWFRRARGESGSGVHPVHRALRDPGGDPAGGPEGGSDGPGVVHRLLLAGLGLPASPRVLDAGCGYGATAFDLIGTTGGEWLGLTLSPIQAERGRAEAARRGLAGRIGFRVASYDAPIEGRFDLIIGIESLIHSPDPAHTIANLAAALAPGGALVVVDDMPEPGLPPAEAAEVALFRQMWRCPVAPGRDGWVAAMVAAGLRLEREADLTPLTLPRSEAALAEPLRRARRRAAVFARFGFGLRTQADLGGMTLEGLLRRGAVRYRLLVGRAPG